MPCNGICLKPEFKFIRNGQKPFYANGASRCNGRCQVFLNCEGLYCVCCGVRLRKHARNKQTHQTRVMIDDTRIS